MSVFADACALVVFFGQGGAGMSAKGMALMREGEVMVSAITVWEITRKQRMGRLPMLPAAWAEDFSGSLMAEGFRLMPLTAEVAEAANALPPHHADPIDRMLIATALVEGAGLVTLDRVFARYGVGVVW